MNRDQRTTLAQKTLSILSEGGYRNSSGQFVSLAEELDYAVRSSRLYRPSEFPDDLPVRPPLEHGVTVEVTAESTLEAARRLSSTSSGIDVLCLNFASAKNPGGGFLGGSQAQEEALARSSGLYPCLAQMTEMYDANRRVPTCLYSDYMIYSPKVPIFRDDTGDLLESPYTASIISAPAVNAWAVRRNEPANIASIEPVLRERMAKLLWVAHQQNHDVLVLGAWGCGVFGNDPAMVATLFFDLLGPGGKYESQFGRIVFAVYDRTEGQEVLRTFQNIIRL